MSIELSKADEPNAKLTLKLKADSGYSCEYSYIISANQWGDILAICEKPATPAPERGEKL